MKSPGDLGQVDQGTSVHFTELWTINSLFICICIVTNQLGLGLSVLPLPDRLCIERTIKKKKVHIFTVSLSSGAKITLIKELFNVDRSFFAHNFVECNFFE